MKLKNRNLKTPAALLMGLALVSGSNLMAEEVTSTKKAPLTLNDSVVKPYASFTLRYYNYEEPSEAAKASQAKTQFRPKVGLSILDGQYELYAYSYIDRKTGTQEFETTKHDVYLVPKALEFGPAKLGMYVKQSLDPNFGTNSNYVAAYSGATYKIESLSPGSISLDANYEFGATFANGGKSTYRSSGQSSLKEDSLSLQNQEKAKALKLASEDEGATYTGTKRSPDLYGELATSVSFTPNSLKDLTVSLTNFGISNWAEEVVESDEGELDSNYVYSSQTSQRLRINYKASDKLSVINDLWFDQAGNFGKQGGYNALNVTYLNYTLF